MNLRSHFVLLALTSCCITLFLSKSLFAYQADGLVLAAKKGDWDSVKEMANQGVDLNLAMADGTTAAHWAAFQNDVNAMNWLIKNKSDIDQPNEYRVTPLSLACELGCSEVAIRLIDAGADVEAKRMGGERPMMLSARVGSVKILRHLIQNGAAVDAREAKGQTALMWAAAEGNVEAVELLLEAKADPELRLKKSGFNAFLFAAREGRLEVIDTLLRHGCDVNQTLKPVRAGGRNPRNNMSGLLLAIESGHFELALHLVAQGADPNDQRSGFGPLHAVTWVRKTRRGDDPSGDPPPRGSGKIDSLSFVDQMIAGGTDVNLRLSEGRSPGKAQLNSKGATPFLMAAKTADLSLLKLLVQRGADPTITNEDGCNALMAAAGIGAVAVGEEPGTEAEVLAVVEWLHGLGIDVNAVDKNLETAMHGAAYRNYPRVVELLTKLGSDPEKCNHKNKFGWTPHDIGRGKRPGSVKPSPPTLAKLDLWLEANQ